MQPDYYMVFDVESVGLHGEGFWVGWVVVDGEGKVQDEGSLASNPDEADGAEGDEAGRAWVAENIPVPASGYNAHCPGCAREDFWLSWKAWKAKGAVLVADCAWPVEARFLAQCVDDAPQERSWEGPYPLHDLASIRLAVGLDPLGTEERRPDELPIHDPLADARQSARLLIEALRVCSGSGVVGGTPAPTWATFDPLP